MAERIAQKNHSGKHFPEHKYANLSMIYSSSIFLLHADAAVPNLTVGQRTALSL